MKTRHPALDQMAKRLDDWFSERFSSNAEAAKALGVPENFVQRARKGLNEPGLLHAADFAEKAGIDLGWLAGLKKPPIKNDVKKDILPVVLIPKLNARASAGSGRILGLTEKVEDFYFPRQFLVKLGANVDKTECLRVDGDSMSPTITSDALLMVDRTQNDAPRVRSASTRRATPPSIYAVLQSTRQSMDQYLRVKRIERVDDRFYCLISDNVHQYPPEIVPVEEIKIVGKVVWWDNRL